MEVVVRPATALYVDAHALEHLKLLSIAVDLKDFSLVLLEESDEGELWFLRLGVAKVCSRLGCGKQMSAKRLRYAHICATPREVKTPEEYITEV